MQLLALIDHCSDLEAPARLTMVKLAKNIRKRNARTCDAHSNVSIFERFAGLTVSSASLSVYGRQKIMKLRKYRKTNFSGTTPASAHKYTAACPIITGRTSIKGSVERSSLP